MIRNCNGSDPNLKTLDGQVGNCGRTFEDINHWTTCPHDEFPINQAAAALINDRTEREPGIRIARADGGADTQPIVPGDPAATDPAGAARKLIGPAYAHTDAPCTDACYEPADAEQATTEAPAPAGASDSNRIAVAHSRYRQHLHAVQSGIAYLMQHRPKMVEVKHLRVGIDSLKVEMAALATLLINRGVFTEAEYVEALADAMAAEVARSEKELSELYGVTVTLS